jgi:hypothetical protein
MKINYGSITTTYIEYRENPDRYQNSGNEIEARDRYIAGFKSNLPEPATKSTRSIKRG